MGMKDRLGYFCGHIPHLSCYHLPSSLPQFFIFALDTPQIVTDGHTPYRFSATMPLSGWLLPLGALTLLFPLTKPYLSSRPHSYHSDLSLHHL